MQREPPPTLSAPSVDLLDVTCRTISRCRFLINKDDMRERERELTQPHDAGVQPLITNQFFSIPLPTSFHRNLENAY